jgi:hypothetical protein
MSVPGVSLPDDRYRRIVGLSLGALAGATYAAVHQVGDRLVIPGAPLYQPPFGLAGNVLVFALVGGLLGLIAAWPRSGVAGTFLAAGVSALTIVGASYIAAGASAGQNVLFNMFNGMILALPFWGLLVPLIGGLRWVVSREEEAKRDGQPRLRRAIAPLILLLVIGLASLTALYGNDARVLIVKTNQLLQGVQATGSVPEPLSYTALATRGQGPYELSWERERIERFRIPRPAGNLGQHSVVVARFNNGYNLVCLYVNLTEPPLCQDVEVIPP